MNSTLKFIFTIVFAFIFSSTGKCQTISAAFNGKWEFRKAGDKTWYPAEVPGTVHTDLLASKLIADPFYGDNEKQLQWIEKETWEYRTLFIVPPAIEKKREAALVFDGLDTYADIYLNGKLLMQADNMFRQWEVKIKKHLVSGKNELRIVFKPAVIHDDSLAAIAALKLAGENTRMYSRKAQYQYGWDWGPRFVTAGIWKAIHWEAWDDARLFVEPGSKTWNVNLVTEPSFGGKSFYFTKNGKPVFIKGVNWIPCESFLPRAKKLDLYRKLIVAAKEANINMLRVWGGGVYEDDEFYDLCDRYDIMVWQDFMFAGAMYPGDQHFLENVEEEIRYQVKRLRKHPCIVLWCGNNEIDEAWHNWGWQKQYNYSPSDSAKLWNDYRRIFHELIPGILKELDPSRPYWPSSPSNGWGREIAYREGDVHYWGVWWGKEPVEKYQQKIGRFNSEYGMQAFPHMRTIQKFGDGNADTSSASMKNHQKHPFGYPNIKLYIENKFRTPASFADLVYVSQLMQADAIKTAIDAHRSKMPYTMGTMFWQWNDCWPVVSWSAIDYYGEKKALYYEVKRRYAKNILSILSPGPDVPKSVEKYIYGTFIPGTDSSVEVEISTTVFDFDGKKIEGSAAPLVYQVSGKPIHFSFVDVTGLQCEENCFTVFQVRAGGKLLCEEVGFSAIPKQLNLPSTKIQWKLLPGNRLELLSGKFAYGVFVDLPIGVEADDNFFHLLPGRKKIIQLSGRVDPSLIKKYTSVRSLVDTY